MGEKKKDILNSQVPLAHYTVGILATRAFIDPTINGLDHDKLDFFYFFGTF